VGQTYVLYFVVHTRGRHLQIGEGFSRVPSSVFCCFYVIVWLVRNTPVRGGKFHFAQKKKLTLGFILRNCGLAVFFFFFRLVFYVALLHFFFAAYVTLLCECGVITSRLVRD